jgi:hypothetical protein
MPRRHVSHLLLRRDRRRSWRRRALLLAMHCLRVYPEIDLSCIQGGIGIATLACSERGFIFWLHADARQHGRRDDKRLRARTLLHGRLHRFNGSHGFRLQPWNTAGRRIARTPLRGRARTIRPAIPVCLERPSLLESESSQRQTGSRSKGRRLAQAVASRSSRRIDSFVMPVLKSDLGTYHDFAPRNGAHTRRFVRSRS